MSVEVVEEPLSDASVREVDRQLGPKVVVVVRDVGAVVLEAERPQRPLLIALGVSDRGRNHAKARVLQIRVPRPRQRAADQVTGRPILGSLRQARDAVQRHHRPRVVDQAGSDALRRGRDAVERGRTANAVPVTTGVATRVAVTGVVHAVGNIVSGAGRQQEGKGSDVNDTNTLRPNGTVAQSCPQAQGFNLCLAKSPPGSVQSRFDLSSHATTLSHPEDEVDHLERTRARRHLAWAGPANKTAARCRAARRENVGVCVLPP